MKILACAVVGLIGVGSVFAQNKVPAPSVEPFEGVWLGRVIAPNASTEIGFAFTRTPRGLGAKFAMPAMFVSGLNLGLAKIVGDTYAMPDLGIKLTCAGDTLVGTFANPLLRVELRRAGAGGSGGGVVARARSENLGLARRGRRDRLRGNGGRNLSRNSRGRWRRGVAMARAPSALR